MKALDLVITDVNFRLTVMEHEGQKWVPLRPICEAIGVASNKQINRVKDDPRFRCNQLVSPSNGGIQTMVFIPLVQLEAFLFTINSRKSMDPKVAHRLLEFQKSLTEMIHKSFNGEILTNEMYKSLFSVIHDLKQEMVEMREANNLLTKRLVQVEQENYALRQASQYRGSEAAYGMLARKAEKKTFKGPTPA